MRSSNGFSKAIYVTACAVLNLSSLTLAQQAVSPDEARIDSASVDQVHVVPPRVISGMVPVVTTVDVIAEQEALRSGVAAPYHVTRSDVFVSAGTFTDFTRFLLVLPGVVWNSDASNDLIVRGGHPSENLYVVDGIEVPNINHISLEGTSGGFTSMIDTSSIDSVDMKSGVYDARYSSRLSSLISIQTRDVGPRSHADELNIGIAGMGGFLERSLGRAGIFISAHRSTLNMVTKDIGLNGTPVYSNGMARVEWSPGERDKVSVLSVNGADSINITPCAGDAGETLNVDTQYDGLRSTEGVVWQHVHRPEVVSTITGSFSTQGQNVGQQMQDLNGQYSNFEPSNHCIALMYTAIYKEKTHDRVGTLGYGVQVDKGGWLLSAGAVGRVTSLDYSVNQPVGQLSPFNASTTPQDVTNFVRNLSVGESGTYAEATGHPVKRWTTTAGVRFETFALLDAHLLEPRGSVAFQLNEHQTLSAEYGRSSQLPSYINLLSYPQNAHLRPVQAEQFSVGADLWRGSHATISLQAYHKRYSDEPVSTEYPSLMLANMVTTLGQTFVWLPLKSGGRGVSQGLEMLLRSAWPSRIRLLSSVTYSRTRYRAQDGVSRSGNFDIPLVGNLLATVSLPRAIRLNLRDTYASGRPYTPFDVSLSEAQFRGIYDLTLVNGRRGPSYNRLDIEASRDFRIGKGLLNLYGGVDNVLGRQNFLGYQWLDRCPLGSTCNGNGAPMLATYQMPLLPAVGMRFQF
jgi:hypothetical protein